MVSIKQLVAIAGGTAVVALGTVGTSATQAATINFDKPVAPFGVSTKIANQGQSEYGFTMSRTDLEGNTDLDLDNPPQTATQTLANLTDSSPNVELVGESRQEEGAIADPNQNNALREYSSYLEYATQVDAQAPDSGAAAYLSYQHYANPPKEVPEPFSAFGLLALGVWGAGQRLGKRRS